MQLRKLHADDLPDLLKLSDAAGWNQTGADWLRLLRLWPEGCLGIDDSGRVAASITVALYGGELAWIGMVLTDPEYRGRGLARRLMTAALDLCGGAVVRLDASDMGKPLYERLGFVDECTIERWRREPGPFELGPGVEALGAVDRARDAEVFGADRSALLEDLAQGDSARAGDAYAFGREGARAAYFGPCISGSEENADALVRWFVNLRSVEAVAWDLFPHTPAASLAARHGFRPVRRLTRMVRCPHPPELPDGRVWAIAGFETG